MEEFRIYVLDTYSDILDRVLVKLNNGTLVKSLPENLGNDFNTSVVDVFLNVLYMFEGGELIDNNLFYSKSNALLKTSLGQHEKLAVIKELSIYFITNIIHNCAVIIKNKYLNIYQIKPYVPDFKHTFAKYWIHSENGWIANKFVDIR